MSSLYVRRLTKTWAAAFTVPFYNTVSEEHNPTAPIWATAEFQAYGATKDSYCSTFVEDGMITLLFFGVPGTGEEALLAVAETQSVAFFNQVDPTGRLTLEVLNPPQIYGADTPWLAAEIPVGYSYRNT